MLYQQTWVAICLLLGSVLLSTVVFVWACPTIRCPNCNTPLFWKAISALRDLDGNNATIADYLNGPGIDNKLRQTTSGATASYLITDHLGTTRALADTNGSLTSSLSYDSFGNVNIGFFPSRTALAKKINQNRVMGLRARRNE